MNKVTIVTSGSRGIGAATAKLAAKRGYAVGVEFIYTDIYANCADEARWPDVEVANAILWQISDAVYHTIGALSDATRGR